MAVADRIADTLRRWADRISPGTAFRATGYRLRFVERVGGVVDRGEGVLLWYRTQDYDDAFVEDRHK